MIAQLHFVVQSSMMERMTADGTRVILDNDSENLFCAFHLVLDVEV